MAAGDPNPREEREGTRRVLVLAVLAAVILGAAITSSLFVYPTGNSRNSPNGELGAQNEGVAGKKSGTRPNVSDNQPNTVGMRRYEDIMKSEKPKVQLSQRQRRELRNYVARHKDQRQDSVDIPISIGAAVPKQTKLLPLDGGLADALPDYRGDRYMLVQNKLIIVEKGTRRIVAIIPVSA